MDWSYCYPMDLYRHPESGVIVLGEDMPDELKPDTVTPCQHCVLP